MCEAGSIEERFFASLRVTKQNISSQAEARATFLSRPGFLYFISLLNSAYHLEIE
jgi:hypothetical protein